MFLHVRAFTELHQVRAREQRHLLPVLLQALRLEGLRGIDYLMAAALQLVVDMDSLFTHDGFFLSRSARAFLADLCGAFVECYGTLTYWFFNLAPGFHYVEHLCLHNGGVNPHRGWCSI